MAPKLDCCRSKPTTIDTNRMNQAVMTAWVLCLCRDVRVRVGKAHYAALCDYDEIAWWRWDSDGTFRGKGNDRGNEEVNKKKRRSGSV